MRSAFLASWWNNKQMEDGSLKVVVVGSTARRHPPLCCGHGRVSRPTSRTPVIGGVVEATELVQSTSQALRTHAAVNDIRMAKGWPSPEQVRIPGLIADVIATHIALWLKRQAGPAGDPRSRGALAARRTPCWNSSALLRSHPRFEVTRRRAIDFCHPTQSSVRDAGASPARPDRRRRCFRRDAGLQRRS